MNAQRGPVTVGIIPNITGDQARRLLRVGVSGQKHSVDRLMERLELPDGERWLNQALRHDALRACGDPVTAFAHGKAGLEELDRMKDASKVLVVKTGDEDKTLTGILGYFLAVAAALTHHQTLISSRPREHVDPILLDLAAVLPEPWADLMCRATLVENALSM